MTHKEQLIEMLSEAREGFTIDRASGNVRIRGAIVFAFSATDRLDQVYCEDDGSGF